MTNVQGKSQRGSVKNDFDAVIIGAGFSGMYMLHSLRDKLDLNVTVFEAGDGVGGTWYSNRYPGARCNSDSYIYCYTFNKNLLQEWNWSERYPENRTKSCATSSAAPSASTLSPTSSSASASSRSSSTTTPNFGQCAPTKATSPGRASSLPRSALCRPPMPPIKGLSSFEGQCYHTSQWPHDGVDFTAKRVGVIGTGATAVPAIPEIAQQAKHLTVFQRTPNSACLRATEMSIRR